MVNDVAAHPDDGDKLEKFGTTDGTRRTEASNSRR